MSFVETVRPISRLPPLPFLRIQYNNAHPTLNGPVWLSLCASDSQPEHHKWKTKGMKIGPSPATDIEWPWNFNTIPLSRRTPKLSRLMSALPSEREDGPEPRDPPSQIRERSRGGEPARILVVYREDSQIREGGLRKALLPCHWLRDYCEWFFFHMKVKPWILPAACHPLPSSSSLRSWEKARISFVVAERYIYNAFLLAFSKNLIRLKTLQIWHKAM